jgi:hypothetical protein
MHAFIKWLERQFGLEDMDQIQNRIEYWSTMNGHGFPPPEMAQRILEESTAA